MPAIHFYPDGVNARKETMKTNKTRWNNQAQSIVAQMILHLIVLSAYAVREACVVEREPCP